MTETQVSIDIQALREQLLQVNQLTYPGRPATSQTTLIAQSQSAVSQPSQLALGTSPRDHHLPTRHSHSDSHHVTESLLSLPATVQESNTEHATVQSTSAFDIAIELMGSQYDNDATQPISQSVHEEIIRRSRSERHSTISYPSATAQRLHEETQFSLTEGDEGHIDITSSFVQPQAVLNNDDESFAFSLTQTQQPLTQFPESQRFKTPATAGRKRTYDGEVIDTPVFPRNPLLSCVGDVSTTDVLRLSQAFAATQAASSPLINGLVSELRSDRPSPNVAIQMNRQLNVSSPLLDYIPAETSSVKGSKGMLVAVQELQDRLRGYRAGETPMARATDQSLNGSPSLRNSTSAGKSRVTFDGILRKEPDSSESIPSSPPLRVPAEDLDTQLAEDVSAEPATLIHTSSKEMKHKTDIVTSSANNYTNTTVIPDTLKRTRLSLPHDRSLSALSPSAKVSQLGPTQQPDQNTLNSTANSQIAPYFTQLTTVSEESHTRFDTIDRISASPEKELETTQQAMQSGHTVIEDRRPAADEHEAGSVHDDHPIPRPVHHSSPAVPETSSNSVQIAVRKDCKGTAYATIAARTSQRERAEDDSSQPVRATPPGRKRKALVLDDEVDDFGTPVQTQISMFDARAALALDEVPDVAQLLVSTPKSSPVIARKRRKAPLVNSPPDLAVNDVQTSAGRLSPIVTSRNDGPRREQHAILDVDVDNDSGPSSTPRAVRNTVNVDEALQTPPRTTRPSIYDTMPSPMEVRRPSRLRAPRTPPVPSVTSTETRTTQLTPWPPALRAPPNTMSQLPAVSSDLHAFAPAVAARSSPAPDLSPVIAPSMVFAHYFGRSRAYYPAKCLSSSADGSRYTIQWPGYDPEEVDKFGVCALELRVGDSVKVDAKGFSRTPYSISGFKVISDTVSDESITDIHGHTHVTIVPKQKHDLLGKRQKLSEQNVAVADIYLDSNMWARMQTRKVIMKPTMSATRKTGTSTPSVRPSTPSTPPSRSRQLLEESSFVLPDMMGIFAGMAFALSLEEDRARDSTTVLIKGNGGAIIKNSFQELFDESMNLRPQLRSLGFVALISDRHSRKEKYMQALALGLPCVSKKWIEASVKHNELADWTDYLLPAGESIELDGAIRSRKLRDYNADTARLATTLAERHNFFTDGHCIFTSGTKKAEARRKTHLTLAKMMGVNSLDMVNDLTGAEQEISSCQHKKIWLLVDDREVTAARGLVDKVMAKRRKARHKAGHDSGNGGGQVELVVMDPESMMQSLILGRFCAGG